MMGESSFSLLLYLAILGTFIPVKVIGEVDDENGSVISRSAGTSSVIAFCDEDKLLSSQTTLNKGGITVRNKNVLEIPGNWSSTQYSIKFSLTYKETSCKSSSGVHLQTDKNSSVVAHFYPNGYFRYDLHIYAPDEYCLERILRTNIQDESSPDGEMEMRINLCKPDCGVGRPRPCIMKCCPLDQIFGGGKGSKFCVSPPPGSSQFAPTLYSDYNIKLEGESSLNAEEGIGKSGIFSSNPVKHLFGVADSILPHFILNSPKTFRPNCVDGDILPLPSSEISAKLLTIRQNVSKEYHSSPFRIRKDGAIMFKSLENKCEIMKSPDNICIDGMYRALSNDTSKPFNNREDEYILFQCRIIEKDPSLDKYLSFTFGVLLLVTSIFPLMTFVGYVLLWKKQNVHGWTIAATSGSLFFMYIFQGSAHLIGITLKEEALNTLYCRSIGVLTHFFMMSTFTWLTVMSCDLWLTFRSVAPINHRLHGVSRYLKYSVFGWGIPTIIVTIGILMDFVLSSSTDCSYHAVPGYGQESCWIVENSLGEYLYYPAGCLLCVNILLFAATCIKLFMYGRRPKMRTGKNNDAFGECFSRFTKLFCVMGISWIFEIVSWYVDGLGFVWYWNIIDVFNILRAIGVFVLYICKQDIIMQLEELYPCIQICLRPFGSLFSRKSSQEMRTDTAVLTGIPASPAIQLKAINNRNETEENKTKQNLIDIPN